MPAVWLVVPTYNEAELVEDLLRDVHRVLAATGAEFRILVVDDASPDGTGAIVDRLAGELPEVQALHRPGKLGLGPAYRAGFAQALESGAGVVMQMDADFSHDPADLPRLLAALDAGADVALGSRYVPGGGVEDWGRLRRNVSRGGSAYARVILGLSIRDLTGGFKAWSRGALEAIDLASVRSEGYAFQIEMTYRAVLRGLRVVEVPITFRDRRLGRSKMSSRIALEAMVLVPRLRRLRSDKLLRSR